MAESEMPDHYIKLSGPLTCGDCNVPVIVREKRLRIEGATKQYGILCPVCNIGLMVRVQSERPFQWTPLEPEKDHFSHWEVSDGGE